MPHEPHQQHRPSYYLEDIPLGEAHARFAAALARSRVPGAIPGEPVSLEHALGRVTAEPVWAKQSSPHYHAAAMDGAAVRAADTTGALETSPLRLRLGDQAAWVNTGDPMPLGFDAVIMREVIHDAGDGAIEIHAPAAPWQHVRPMGEDIVATELVLPENHILRPQDIGAIAAAGMSHVIVRRKPRVAILPTGSELVAVGGSPQPGQIIEYNSLMLAAQVTQWGGAPQRLPPLPDDRNKLRDALLHAVADSDVVVINAGSSAGSRDFTAPVVQEAGELLVHGVAVRPGHPVVLGLVRGVPVLGIPGYPASAVVTSEMFLQPLLTRLLGLPAPAPSTVDAVMTRKILSPMGEDEFLRVTLGMVDGRLVAAPLPRGAGIIMSLVRADGLAHIPRFSEGIAAGAPVTVHLRRPLAEIERAIVAIGSHDVTLDLLASHLQRHTPGTRLSSSNAGSLGGLLALQRAEAHLAGTHLLDEATGEYNRSFVNRYVAGQGVLLVTLAHRVQGLMLAKGNPLGIASLADLSRPDVTFVNRQRGSGTRVLLDYRLKQLGLAPQSIRGYEREEYTHLAVAAAVASGAAATGLGVLAAARALALDFLPIATERYDLAIPRRHYNSERLAPLRAVLASDSFQRDVLALGGYDLSAMGHVVAEIP
ncbi:MAG: molybdopterin biosynthesis protein [Dehalococcoidia bacterium]|nr:molybdopterin biosynthesis protein [Dehalococcoidia bacterium]